MWPSKLRPQDARRFALLGMTAGLATLSIIVIGMHYLCEPLPDTGLATKLQACRARLLACTQDFTGPDHTRSNALAKLSDRFAYRRLPEQSDPQRAYGKTLSVGPGQDYTTIARAVLAARDGDIIAISPGTYPGESMIIRGNDLTLRGEGGIATIDATKTPLLQDKAILITQGRNLLLENIELKNAASPDHNGAAIRAEGPSLHVRHCFIHDNEAGILVSNRADSTVVVEYSEFARNGHRDGQAHQIYAGLIAQLSLRYNFIHNSFIGSAIKSRAAYNLIEYNFVADGATGSANYTVDLSAGGYALLVGNVLEKGPRAQNRTFVSYAPESLAWPDNALFMSHNTLVNDGFDSTFITNHADIELHAINNLFIGRGVIVAGGPVQLLGNMVLANPRYGPDQDSALGGAAGSGRNRIMAAADITDRAQLDYHLTPASGTIDAASPIPAGYPATLTALSQYHHAAASVVRGRRGARDDIGAFEFADPTPASTQH
jgi:Right handed beta helix region